MFLKGHGEMDPKALATELLRERDIITRYIQETRELRARVARYEARYGIKSDELHRAIDEGRLQETDEVCDWIFDYESLQERDAAHAG